MHFSWKEARERETVISTMATKVWYFHFSVAHSNPSAFEHVVIWNVNFKIMNKLAWRMDYRKSINTISYAMTKFDGCAPTVAFDFMHSQQMQSFASANTFWTRQTMLHSHQHHLYSSAFICRRILQIFGLRMCANFKQRIHALVTYKALRDLKVTLNHESRLVIRFWEISIAMKCL